MPIRFAQVSDKLYRGGAPKEWEVKALKDEFGIEKIISLDKDCGKDIEQACIENNINHVMLPIHMANSDQDLSIILNEGPTKIIGNDISYVHCRHGKDRTGLFVILYRMENGSTCKEAVDDALTFGFCIGLSDNIIDTYHKCIVSKCKADHKHIPNNYILHSLINKKECMECGMIKPFDDYCKSCTVANAIIKSAKLAIAEDFEGDNTKLFEDRDSLDIIDQEDKLGGVNAVSDLFNVPQSVTAKESRYYRRKVIEYMYKKAISEQQISFDVPVIERKIAVECIEELDKLKDLTLDHVLDHLDIMYQPFKSHNGITPEQAKDASVHFLTFTETMKENMTRVKRNTMECMIMLEKFESDTEIFAMKNSMDESVDSIEKQENVLTDILEDVEAVDFQENIIKAIDAIKKEIAQFKQLIEERIIEFIKKNILQEDWKVIRKEIADDIKELQQEGD